MPPAAWCCRDSGGICDPCLGAGCRHTASIFDIMEMYESGYELFKAIVNLDLYEVFNNRMLDLLINYGEGIVFLSDAKASEKYFAILQDKDTFIEIRNEILLKYLENVEVDSNYGNA